MRACLHLARQQICTLTRMLAHHECLSILGAVMVSSGMSLSLIVVLWNEIVDDPNAHYAASFTRKAINYAKLRLSSRVGAARRDCLTWGCP